MLASLVVLLRREMTMRELLSCPPPLIQVDAMHRRLAVRAMRCAVAIVLMMAGAVSSLAQAPPAVAPGAPSSQVSSQADRLAYRLGPDDQIVIQVPNAIEISGKAQRVDPSGDIRLPMIGRIHAGGMTVEELETELTSRLKEYLHEPDVSVAVTEFKSQPVAVIGAVLSSGLRQLEGRKTLIELLSLAGGVTVDAGPIVRIARRRDQGAIPVAGASQDKTGGFSIADIDLRALLEGRNPDLNVVIRPHDVVSIPRAEMVFVVGEVGRPGPVPLSGGGSVSVLEAVSSSGGVLRTAATSNVRILRQRAGEPTRTEVSIDLKKVMRGQAADVQLMAGDILVIPDSKGKRAGARALEAAIQTGVIVGTYGFAR
jgi:polysaccharide export outer membrane protein